MDYRHICYVLLLRKTGVEGSWTLATKVNYVSVIGSEGKCNPGISSVGQDFLTDDWEKKAFVPVRHE